MYEYFACTYMCMPHEYLMPMEVRKRVLDPVDLKFKMVVSHLIDARNQIQALWERGKYF